jgi:hypothetical protein
MLLFRACPRCKGVLEIMALDGGYYRCLICGFRKYLTLPSPFLAETPAPPRGSRLAPWKKSQR